MTYQEQQEYNRLPYDARQDYDFYSKKYPHWTHTQLINRIALGHEIDKMTNNGKNVDINDPGTVAAILRGAKAFLQRVGIYIQAIFDYIDNILDELGDLIVKGITFVGDILDDIFS